MSFWANISIQFCSCTVSCCWAFCHIFLVVSRRLTDWQVCCQHGWALTHITHLQHRLDCVWWQMWRLKTAATTRVKCEVASRPSSLPSPTTSSLEVRHITPIRSSSLNSLYLETRRLVLALCSQSFTRRGIASLMTAPTTSFSFAVAEKKQNLLGLYRFSVCNDNVSRRIMLETCQNVSQPTTARSSSIAEGPRDAPRQWKSCQLRHNSTISRNSKGLQSVNDLVVTSKTARFSRPYITS